MAINILAPILKTFLVTNNVYYGRFAFEIHLHHFHGKDHIKTARNYILWKLDAPARHPTLSIDLKWPLWLTNVLRHYAFAERLERRIAVYHRQTHSQVKRYDRTLVTILRHYGFKPLKDWDPNVPPPPIRITPRRGVEGRESPLLPWY